MSRTSLHKGKPIRLGLSLLIATLLQLSPNTLVQAADSPTQADLEEIISTIARVQDRIQRTQRERSSVQEELTQTEKSIVTLNQQVADISNQIDAEELHLAELIQNTRNLEQSKAEQKALIGQYIRSIHQTGREEYVKLLLNQNSIELASRTLNYYQYFNQARAARVSTYNETIAELASLQQQTEITTQQLQANRLQLNEQQTTLSSSQQQRQNLLDSLDSTLSNSGNELAELEINRAEMEFLLAELARSIANMSLNTQPFTERKGNMPWPSAGRLLNSFGSSYGEGDLDWEGVTIAGSQGDPVQAIHHGRVVFSEWFSNSGLLLIIDHGDGYMSLYGHNQLLYKEVGDWVNAGETIAAIGNTGGRRENGVYFEIRHDGSAQDPVNWCAARN